MTQANVNPIIDAGLELSVSYHVPSDVIVGNLFNFLHQKDENVGLQKLPVSNIPDEIRRMDPNLKDKPTHQLSCKYGFVQIGENVLCVGGMTPYVSWAEFYKFITEVIAFLSENALVLKVEFVKLRYLNFFKENIFKAINLSITMEGVDALCEGSTIFRTEIPCGDGVLGVLQITNGVHVKNVSLGLDDDGSLIDIQTISKQASMESLPTIIDQLHQEVEKLFSNLTKKEGRYE